MGDKCKGLRAKENIAYTKFRKAWADWMIILDRADGLCRTMSEVCKNYNDEKTGDELTEAQRNCEHARERCNTEIMRFVGYEDDYDAAYTEYIEASKDLSDCEHKKSGRKK
jgi:hypothetical protein